MVKSRIEQRFEVILTKFLLAKYHFCRNEVFMNDLSELYSILLLTILDENDCEYAFPVLICIQC